MNQPLAIWHNVLPSGTLVFGPFDAREDAQAPPLDIPRFRFSYADRQFVAYSAAPLSEADRQALLQKTVATLGSVTARRGQEIVKNLTAEPV